MNDEDSEKINAPASLRSVITGLISGGIAVTLCYFTWAQPELLDQVLDAPKLYYFRIDDRR